MGNDVVAVFADGRGRDEACSSGAVGGGHSVGRRAAGAGHGGVRHHAPLPSARQRRLLLPRRSPLVGRGSCGLPGGHPSRGRHCLLGLPCSRLGLRLGYQ
ncbi:hypothetical protein GQ55_2G006300 [Panicum hallii var. hallii]|uniref:Uncharacterized protein n=1 Tax=Panicum hallii var. hallii TaxID=1504633 RepID=A0A2T7EK45_9POAL|nr:hypothetical protein GQ55_2G006300 [Panicum hallii var. hallii]